MFEIWELRKIFGPMREEVTGDKRLLLIGLLHYLTSVLYVIILLKTGKKVVGRGMLHTLGRREMRAEF